MEKGSRGLGQQEMLDDKSTRRLTCQQEGKVVLRNQELRTGSLLD